MLSPLAQMNQRVDDAKRESDVEYFLTLLSAGELLTKIYCVALVACIEDDTERSRYRLEHSLVRADGIGSWASAIDDCLTGPASQSLDVFAREAQRQLTESVRSDDDGWQAEAIVSLNAARLAVDADVPALPMKFGVRRWFSEFAALRNRTRGHGSPTPAKCAAAAPCLQRSLDLLSGHLSLLQQPWVHLHRNLSGKYRVTALTVDDSEFAPLRTERDKNLPAGVHFWLGQPRHVPLITAGDNFRDFFMPNGGADADKYQVLCYVTDERRAVPLDGYHLPTTPLPASETEGRGVLDVFNNVFANLPSGSTGYISRRALEEELTSVLTNDRHPIVTLVGRGGIGKTSLALHVLTQISSLDRFFSIVWFSARDIDLLPEGPKPVQPDVLTIDDLAARYCSLVQPDGFGTKGFDPVETFSKGLSDSKAGPSLFVFDNFETVRSPVELYKWIDTYVRSPHKVLITTRQREFKADYPVEVGGMTEDEFAVLVDATASRLGIRELVDSSYVSALHDETDGHPYVAKVMLGEVAREGKAGKVSRMMASRDGLLEALFERTYSTISPAAQRVFLTLSGWRSMVPVVGLQAAITRPGNSEFFDVEQAIDVLERSSLVEVSVDERDGAAYVRVPLSAALFGNRKRQTSSWSAAIDADLELLKMFGPTTSGSNHRGFGNQVERLFKNVAARLPNNSSAAAKELERLRPILEFVSQHQPAGWLLLAQLVEEVRPSDTWKSDVEGLYRRYLEAKPHDGDAWRALAKLCRQLNDPSGEVQALIHGAQTSGADYSASTYAAAQIARYLADGSLDVDTDEKRALVSGLAELMLQRRSEARSADDLSRLAWLLMHQQRLGEAREVTLAGLALEPSNPHCSKLLKKLDQHNKRLNLSKR